MKHFQDISIIVVGFLAFALIGYFIHTLANYNYCARELDCVSVRRDSSGLRLEKCDFKVCNNLPSDEVLNGKTNYEPPQGLK